MLCGHDVWAKFVLLSVFFASAPRLVPGYVITCRRGSCVPATFGTCLTLPPGCNIDLLFLQLFRELEQGTSRPSDRDISNAFYDLRFYNDPNLVQHCLSVMKRKVNPSSRNRCPSSFLRALIFASSQTEKRSHCLPLARCAAPHAPHALRVR